MGKFRERGERGAKVNVGQFPALDDFLDPRIEKRGSEGIARRPNGEVEREIDTGLERGRIRS